MICKRTGCGNPLNSERKTKEYCSTNCRRQAFTEKHQQAARDQAIEGFTDAPEKPVDVPEAVVKVKGAKKHAPAPSIALKPKCGHYVPPGARCTQKGCYGVISKKEKS